MSQTARLWPQSPQTLLESLLSKAAEDIAPSDEAEIDPLADPERWFSDCLDCKIYPKQAAMILAVRDHEQVSTVGCNSSGKDWTAARVALWWMASHKPAKVIITGPCFDDQTEILTDRGWRRFADLDRAEKVASLVNGQMQFVRPTDWLDDLYNGPMMGQTTQSLDFLVTPNHRCYVRREYQPAKPKVRAGAEMEETKVCACCGNTVYRLRKESGKQWGTRQYCSTTCAGMARFGPRKEGFHIRQAREFYGQGNWRCSREVNWEGKADDWTEVQYELWGFWFAEGHSQAGCDNGGHWRYRIALTQKRFPVYAEHLMTTAYPDKRVHKDVRSDGVCHFTINNKQLACWFEANFKVGRQKRIPDWLRQATPNKLRAFVYGWMQGDGHWKTGTDDQQRITICGNKALAGELQEVIFKAGQVANLTYYAGADEWKLSFSQQREPQVQADKWYTTQYDGRIYCVHVPSGVVLVRRNGRVHWSGNSYRQVKEVVWQELRSAYLDAKVELGGQLYETPLLRWDEESFIYGFSTDKPYKLQGFHSPALLIIVTEAHGMAQNHIDALWRLNPNKMLMTGNPISESGEFYESHHGKAHLWQTISIDAWDTPNVIEGKLVIPGLVTVEDIERGKRNWGEDSPLFKMTYRNEWVEGMGRLVVVPLSWAQAAERAHYEPGQIEVVGVDVARFGQDETVIYSRRGRVGRLLYRVQGNNTMQTVGYIKGYHDAHKRAHFVVDGVGVGGGIVDRLRELGIGVIDFQGGAAASDSSRFVNITAEMWWRMRNGYEFGLDVEEDSLLRGEVSSRRYEIQSDKRIKLESKDAMKAEGRKSPNTADAFAMTFVLDWQIDGNRLSASSDADLDELDPGLEEDYAKQQHMTLDLSRGSDMAPYRASRWGKIRSRR